MIEKKINNVSFFLLFAIEFEDMYAFTVNLYDDCD